MSFTDKTFCSASGQIIAGATCTHLLTDEITYLDMNQYLDFLEAKPGVHGAAFALSSAEFTQLKTELETACRILGRQCTYELQTAIAKMKVMLTK